MISMKTIISIVVAIVGIVAVKIAITFNLNKWQESRKEIQKIKLQNICPHVSVKKRGDQIIIEDLVVSPSGTLTWHCQQCGRIFHTRMSKDEVEYWGNNPVELMKRKKSLNKLAKKMGLI